LALNTAEARAFAHGFAVLGRTTFNLTLPRASAGDLQLLTYRSTSDQAGRALLAFDLDPGVLTIDRNYIAGI
jgi:hypothetical protein